MWALYPAFVPDIKLFKEPCQWIGIQPSKYTDIITSEWYVSAMVHITWRSYCNII